MGILKALLARACIPLCFIQILKFESGQLLPSDVLFLHVLMTFTAVWIYEIIPADPALNAGNMSRIFGGTSFIASMLLAFALTHDFFQKGNDTRKYLLIDYGFPCLNFDQLLQWMYNEIWYLFFFIYSYLKAIGVGPVKLVCYIFYLGMHAIVVIFILEFITLTLRTEFYFALRDNFYYTFDANTTGAYPDGYLHPLVLDKGLYEKATMTTEMYKCPPDMYSTCTLTWRIKDDEDVKFPLKHKLLYRYNGEDVELTCDYSLTPSSVTAAKMNPPVWYFNESAIAITSRHIVLSTYHQIGESVDVFTSLKVKFLKDTDFGEYVCSCALKSSTYFEDEYGYLAEEYTIKKPAINVFMLNQIKMQPKLIYRVVGNIITSENFFWYNSEADINDMSIAYTVNDRPVDEVCPGFQTQTCSVGASVLRMFIRVGAQRFDWNGAVEFPFIEIGEVPVFGVKRGIVYFCLCSSGYGIHRISFLRKVYSGLTKKYRNEEIVHPFVFIVLPLSTISLFRIYDDTHLYARIEKLVNEEENFDIIEDAVTDLIEFVAANEEKVLTQANVIQAILLIVCVIICYILTLFVSNIYMQVFIEYVPRRVFIPQPMLPETEPMLAIEAEEYDVFLSYSEEEYTFVSETLVPFLENDCELRVCLPNRDFPPNRSIFGSYVDRIRKSRKVIVILSQAYMAEARCRYLQLEHIILPLLYQELRTPKDVLIIKYEEATNLPEPLRWNFQIEVFPWYRQLPVRVKLKTLNKWVFTGHI
ncbi:uncharacterized protein LOC123556489 [Mercenaria mercenaria]|uniref:uncharacterized protein LOC123556489 n=1 Tax=Mercenaria mercenaria TaxID=6596 RepID=UPI00234ED2BF|nr:uncharacterized protein LOC123556489 [Mercenaria mercenaria]